MPPPSEDILRQVLASMFADCSHELKTSDGELPDAAPARELQDELREFIGNPSLPAAVQFTAYLADMMISDVFRNFFGDQISSPETDDARRNVVKRLSQLFDSLATASGQNDDAGRLLELAAFRRYVADYLAIVRSLNESWIAANQLPDMEST